MPIPPRVSVVALRTAELDRSTASYVALGWERAASTTAMSLFKTAGSLLLICTGRAPHPVNSCGQRRRA
jgi:hypothetical protein